MISLDGEGVVLGLSGGLDSVTLLYYLAKYKKMKVYPVFFYYGQKHFVEARYAEWNVKKLQSEGYDVAGLKYVDMQFYVDLVNGFSNLVDGGEDIPDLESVLGVPNVPTYVPFRNMIFAALLAGYAESVGAKFVSLGIEQVDAYSGYWDTTLEFAKRVDEVFELNRQHRIHLIAPFVTLDKAKEIVIGYNLGVDYSKTWTSYKVVGLDENGEPIAWYDAPNSRERVMAFAKVGLKDPVKYDREVDWDVLIERYYKYDVSEDFDEIIREVEENLEKQLTKRWY